MSSIKLRMVSDCHYQLPTVPSRCSTCGNSAGPTSPPCDRRSSTSKSDSNSFSAEKGTRHVLETIRSIPSHRHWTPTCRRYSSPRTITGHPNQCYPVKMDLAPVESNVRAHCFLFVHTDTISISLCLVNKTPITVKNDSRPHTPSFTSVEQTLNLSYAPTSSFIDVFHSQTKQIVNAVLLLTRQHDTNDADRLSARLHRSVSPINDKEQMQLVKNVAIAVRDLLQTLDYASASIKAMVSADSRLHHSPSSSFIDSPNNATDISHGSWWL